MSGAVRLANLAVHPWASLVIMRGDGSDHAMVMLEGSAEVMDAAAAEAATIRPMNPSDLTPIPAAFWELGWDQRGLMYQNQVAVPGTTVRVDDDLLLMMTRSGIGHA